MGHFAAKVVGTFYKEVKNTPEMNYVSIANKLFKIINL